MMSMIERVFQGAKAEEMAFQGFSFSFQPSGPEWKENMSPLQPQSSASESHRNQLL